jgi:hypothetical protein
MNDDVQAHQERELRLRVLIKELEISCNGFQQRTAHKATMLTIFVTMLGIGATLYLQRGISDQGLFFVPFLLFAAYLAYWNQDYNHIVYRCCVRITEAKINSLLGGSFFTWGRDHYYLARSRRPLKHWFNAMIALTILSLVGACAYLGSRALALSVHTSVAISVIWALLIIASLYVTDRAVQQTKRQTDSQVAEIVRLGTGISAQGSEPTHLYGLRPKY